MTVDHSAPGPRHFLFVAGPTKGRTAAESVQVQLGHRIWGLRTPLIKENLQRFLSKPARGVVYIVKEGLRVEFEITSEVCAFGDLDDLLRDEVRAEAWYGFVRIRPLRLWDSSPHESVTLLTRVLAVTDRAELTRRLNLGMHGLTEAQYHDILEWVGPGQVIEGS